MVGPYLSAAGKAAVLTPIESAIMGVTIGSMDAPAVAAGKLQDGLAAFGATVEVTSGVPDSLDITLTSALNNQPVGFDLNLPQLGLAAGTPGGAGTMVEVDLGYVIRLRVSANDTGQVFLDTDDFDDEFAFAPTVTAPGLDFAGTFGPLQATVTDAGTNFTLNYVEDVTGPGASLRIDTAPASLTTAEEISGNTTSRLNLGARMEAEFLKNLPFTLGLSSVLDVTWNFGANDDFSVKLDQITLDVGSTFQDYLKPTFDQIGRLLGPVQSLNDALDREVPLFGTLGLPNTAREVLEKAADTVFPELKTLVTVLDRVDYILDIQEKIDALVGQGTIALGTVVLAGSAPGDLQKEIGSVSGKQDATANPDVAAFVNDSDGNGLAFPFLSDSTNLFRLLLGKSDVTLVTFDSGEVNADLGEQSIFKTTFIVPIGPIPVPVTIGMSLKPTVSAQFAIGFDTAGLQAGRSASDGLFFDKDKTKLNLGLALILDGSAGRCENYIGGAEAGIYGSLNSDVSVTLAGDGEAGKVRFSEITDKIQSGAGCILAFAGAISVEGGFQAKGALPGMKCKTYRRPFARFRIADFSSKPCGGSVLAEAQMEPANLAELTADGTLILNMGQRANLRAAYASPAEINEEFVVSLVGNEIKVVAFGAEQSFPAASVLRIVGDAFDGNDSIDLTGVPRPATLTGGTGDDILIAGTVAALLSGNEGTDNLFGGDGDDVLDGGTGDDYLQGNLGGDALYGGGGNDTLEGDNPDLPEAGGSDSLYGGEGDDQLSGAAGADLLNGGTGTDQLFGGADNDVLDGGAGDDYLAGDESDDSVGGDDYLHGGEGNDEIYGGPGTDTLFGDSGDDTLDGGPTPAEGIDQLFGGEDSDTFIWKFSNGTPGSEYGNVLVEGGTGSDLLAVTGSANGDTILAQAQAGRLAIAPRAGVSIDAAEIQTLSIDGGAGSDRLTVRDLSATGVLEVLLDPGAIYPLVDGVVQPGAVAQPDGAIDLIEILGTLGDDRVVVSVAGYVPDDAPPGTVAVLGVEVRGLPALALIAPREPLLDKLVLLGDVGNDDLRALTNEDGIGPVGNRQPVRPEQFIQLQFEGNAGDDLLLADATLLGGAGNDLFYPIAGTNVIDGGAGFDQIIVDGTNGNDAIALSQAGNVLSINVNGEASSNTTTNVERVVVNGLDGNDTIGLATLAIPTLVEAGRGNDSIDAATTTAVAVTLYGGEGNDTIAGGSLGDEIVGGAGFDSLAGNAGNDTIDGGEGDDIIVGGLGDDRLLGGADSDTFRWAAGDGDDFIEGGTGLDSLVMTGLAAASNRFVVRPGDTFPSRVLSAWDDLAAGTGSADMADVERVSLAGGSAPDLFTIQSLAGTPVTLVETDHGAAGNQDITRVFGTDLADSVAINKPQNGRLDVTGLSAIVRVRNAEALDVLNVLLGAGTDTLVAYSDPADPAVTSTIGFQIEGGAGDDRIEVTAAASGLAVDPPATLLGGQGADTLLGGNSADILLGGAGSDSIAGGLGDDFILGDGDATGVGSTPALITPFAIAPANVATGDDDTLFGDAGNDTINGGHGADQIFGGEGNDLLGAILSTAYDEPGDDSIVGGLGNDTINAGAGDDVGLGGPGSDTINGGAGNDLLHGDSDSAGLGPDFALLPTDPAGGAADLINGDADNDTINGGAGNDTLDGGDGDDVIGIAADFATPSLASASLSALAIIPLDGVYLEPGDDLISGGDGNDSISAGTGNDTVTGGLNDDSILGGEGNDSILGEQGSDYIDAGDGNDTAAGGADRDTILGGLGNDLLTGDGEDDSIDGGEGNDTIQGNGGNDAIDGGAGDDTIQGNDGNDTIHAGSGNDTVDGGLGNDVITGGEGVDSLAGGADNDTIAGGDGADSITGGLGDDSILGDAGNDTIQGNDGNDTILGGLGDDLIDGGEGADSILGGDGNDAITGSAGNDTINGGLGNDAINAGDGDDLVFGEDGDDAIQGGLGNDAIDGGAGNDFILAQAGDDYVDGGLGNDTVQGNEGNDFIAGNAGDDLIHGGLGNDTLSGGDGRDRICGGLAAGEAGDPLADGNDLIDGGADNDAIVGDAGNDTIYGSGGDDQLWGSAGDDSILGGLGADSIVGGDGADVLLGEAGDDVMFGQAGNDTLWGGDGNDLMYGGEGDDTMLGGSPLTANVVHQPRDPSLPSDGDDTMLGGNGFDQVDGGNGNNLMDAGNDGIRETVLGGVGNDIIFSHLALGRRQADTPALDGGYNRDYHRGELVEPPIPMEQCEFVVFAIPASAYTGQKTLHDGSIVEHPPLSSLRGARPGRTVAIRTVKFAPSAKQAATPAPFRARASLVQAVTPARKAPKA
jgi:Ca2+-binding RTX toxin-like protein